MNNSVIKSIYKTVVEEGKEIYKELYESTEVTEKTVDYWKNALKLYRSLDECQKNIFMDVVEQTIIDTISSILGILDGSSTLSEGDFEFEVKVNGIDTENELQDSFLGFVEEQK